MQRARRHTRSAFGRRSPRRAGLVLVATALAAACSAPVPDAGPAFDVMEKTIPELAAALDAGALTSVELVDAYLARIEAYDQRGPRLNAMITLNPNARREAESLDAERARRRARGPLHGVPVVVKDNFDTAAMPTTAGSIALAGWYPLDDAYQVMKLEQAGAIILGKTNMHELAYGITTVSSLGGQTRNPYDPTRNPGGSSGGTAAAVAASFAAAGLGTDTCGSIRIPASHHSLVGLRATRGLSSRDGIVPLALTQDVGGPLARTVTDLAIMLDATVGFDPADEVTSLGRDRVPATFTAFLDAGALEGARIGVLDRLFGDSPDDLPVERVIRAALEEMKQAGAETVDVEIPGVPELLRGASLERREFKFDLADYLRTTPGAPVRSLQEILDRGLYHAAVEGVLRGANSLETRDTTEYRDLLARRDKVRDAVAKVMDDQRLSAMAYPTIRRTAARLGEPQLGNNCALSSVSGLPAVTVPAGRAADGLPVGIELIGRAFDEAMLVRLAYAYEQATRHRQPPATAPSLVAPPLVVRVAGRAKGTGNLAAEARFTFDPPSSELAYQAVIYGIRPGDVLFMHLHRADQGEIGPVVFTLSTPGATRASGTLRLGPAERAALERGRLYFDVHTRQNVWGEAQLALPVGARR